MLLLGVVLLLPGAALLIPGVTRLHRSKEGLVGLPCNLLAAAGVSDAGVLRAGA